MMIVCFYFTIFSAGLQLFPKKSIRCPYVRKVCNMIALCSNIIKKMR